jgi:glycine oxidase
MQAVETLIVGQGLAGTCLAWELWHRGAEFLLVDREHGPASSQVAAGLINPVTGKSWSMSWRYAEFFASAREFYRQVEPVLGRVFFHELAVARLFGVGERAKVEAKMAVCRELAHREVALAPPWRGEHAWEIAGAARLDSPGFIAASREFFRRHGRYRQASADATGKVAGVTAARSVFCEGAVGLLGGVASCLPSRCAKGEILTLSIPGLDEPRLVVGNGGWLVPVGARRYKAGAPYQWDLLDGRPTAAGRAWVERLVAGLLDVPFEVLEHVAGIRPIVRQSQPVIGPLAGRDALIIFNGLGSKGALYAPGTAASLAAWLLDKAPIDAQLILEGLKQ